MVILSLIEGEYSLGDSLGRETILMEFKEFYLTRTISLDEIDHIKKGNISIQIKELIYNSTLYYINKYFDRYLLSLTNISKIHLHTLLNQSHSKICFGVSDDGIITGIPLHADQIGPLKEELINKVLDYYTNIIGLHNYKGDIEVIIDGDIYYDFNKLVNILKKHTRINIHRVTNDRKPNKSCEDLISKIDTIKKEEQSYLFELYEHRRLMNIKIEYNNKYSVPFNRLIRSNDIMNEFKSYTSLTNEELHDTLDLLKSKIIQRNDVELYLLNGLYIDKSIYPDDDEKDMYYGILIKIFLEEYKYFKLIQLRKNISLSKFSMKNPMKKLIPLLNNINVFNQYLDMDYYMIEIEIPFIKDINVYIASKKDKKILERSYTDNNPHTVS